MKQTEKTALKAALVFLSSNSKPHADSPQRIFDKAISNLDAIERGAGGLSDQIVGGFVAIPAVTVANLPASKALNDEAIVTDATVATNGGTVVGGGSFRVLVRYNGTNWLIV